MRVKTGTWLVHILLILAILVALYPLFWMISVSFKAPSEIFGHSISLIPPHPILQNYVDAWTKAPLLDYLWNSFYTSLIITIGQVLTSILAAYALARFDFKGKQFLFLLCVGTMVVPFHVTMIPNYLLVSDLGWLNTYSAVVVPQLANAFGIFMLRQHFMTFPKQITEAAEIDGAGSWRTLWQVILPSLKAPVMAMAILFFLNAWNQYFWPLLVLTDAKMYTFPVGLQTFVNAEAGNNWGPLMAAATIASVPALVIYIVLQRRIIDSYVSSGVKG